MIEEWRTVAICPAYEVSSMGRVRRALPGLKRTRPGNILSITGSLRYRTVTLVLNRVRKTVPLHCLVCETFHGPRPTPAHQVAHRDGNTHNNREDNLLWATAKENASHKIGHGTSVFGEKVGNSKLTEDAVKRIRKIHAERRHGYSETAALFGVDKSLVGLIVRGRVWKHVSAD